VPALVVGPVAGVFVDRWDPRRTMMMSDACCTVLIASLLLLLPAIGTHLSAGTKLGIICAIVAIAGGSV
jgi:MFS-type transporter involved in bile tolerance (Atg22 family)